jgi:hypothetical protein
MAYSFRYIQRGRKLTRTENGFSKTEVIKIFGLAGTTDFEYEAIKALEKRNPPISYACPHSVIPGLYLTSLETMPMGNSKNQCAVLLGWSDLSRVNVRIDGTGGK